MDAYACCFLRQHLPWSFLHRFSTCSSFYSSSFSWDIYGCCNDSVNSYRIAALILFACRRQNTLWALSLTRYYGFCLKYRCKSVVVLLICVGNFKCKFHWKKWAVRFCSVCNGVSFDETGVWEVTDLINGKMFFAWKSVSGLWFF